MRSILLMVTLSVLAYGQSIAAIVVSNLVLTNQSVRFRISGSFPNEVPTIGRFGLNFSNPNGQADPGFALGRFIFAESASFTGVQILRDGPAATGNPYEGDSFFVAFDEDFVPGEQINGVFEATWRQVAFDPGEVTALNLYWGHGGYSPFFETGTYLGSFAIVPESSMSVLLPISAMLIAMRRTRYGQQGGARKPATAPDAKAEGGKNPKPELKRRSQ